MTTTLKIGIAAPEKQRQWALDIAAGKKRRHEDDPLIWFPSMSALARVLSDENMALLNAIRELHPESVDALAAAVGKQQSNVSRSLRMLEPYGLVRLNKNGRMTIPEVTFDQLALVI